MAAQGLERRTRSRSLELLALALGIGLVLGVIVSMSAFLLARYGPSGGSWSFRGNGALAAYTLVPAFLAGGWTAIVLRHRGRPWLGLGVAAVAVGIALAAFDAALLPVFGSGADQSLGPFALLALAAWTVVGPALSLVLPRGAGAGELSTAAAIGAAVAWAVGLAAGVLLTGFAFPAGS